MLKKDMFSIGVILYSTLFGTELWSSIEYRYPDEKIADLNVLHNKIANFISEHPNHPSNSILKIIVGLLQIKINDIISLDKFINMVNDLDVNDRSTSQPSNKKRRIN